MKSHNITGSSRYKNLVILYTSCIDQCKILP